jgi:hypothetical protein
MKNYLAVASFPFQEELIEKKDLSSLVENSEVLYLSKSESSKVFNRIAALMLNRDEEELRKLRQDPETIMKVNFFASKLNEHFEERFFNHSSLVGAGICSDYKEASDVTDLLFSFGYLIMDEFETERRFKITMTIDSKLKYIDDLVGLKKIELEALLAVRDKVYEELETMRGEERKKKDHDRYLGKTEGSSEETDKTGYVNQD